MSRVLVTGGAGFIGSHIVDNLIAADYDVAVLDNLSSGNLDNLSKTAAFYEADLMDSKSTANILDDVRPDAIFHLAAQKSVSASVVDPVMDAKENIIATLQLLEAAKERNINKFVFASTGGALYGETELLPTDEGHPALPESPYGIAKLSIEHYLRFYSQVHGLNATILRLANVYGPRQDPKGEAGVVAIFCSLLLKGQPLGVNGDGLQTRDYVYVADVARAFVQSFKLNESTTLNLGTAREASVLDLVKGLASSSGRTPVIQHHPARPGEVRRSCLSYATASQSLGWSPQTSLEDGLEQTFRWFEERA